MRLNSYRQLRCAVKDIITSMRILELFKNNNNINVQTIFDVLESPSLAHQQRHFDSFSSFQHLALSTQLQLALVRTNKRNAAGRNHPRHHVS